MWNRYNYPTAKDADENGDILILRNNGRKSIYNWEDFCDEKSLARDIAWMPLPPSDNVEGDPGPPITITISSGGRSFTIEKVVSHIEVYDSHDPMGQPIICGDVDDIDGILLVVESILADHIMGAPDDDEDWCECEGEGVAVNDTVLQGFIDAIRGSETEDNCCNELDILKKSELSYAGVVERLRRRISHLESGSETASVPASKPKPWQKKRGI